MSRKITRPETRKGRNKPKPKPKPPIDVEERCWSAHSDDDDDDKFANARFRSHADTGVLGHIPSALKQGLHDLGPAGGERDPARDGRIKRLGKTRRKKHRTPVATTKPLRPTAQNFDPLSHLQPEAKDRQEKQQSRQQKYDSLGKVPRKTTKPQEQAFQDDHQVEEARSKMRNMEVSPTSKKGSLQEKTGNLCCGDSDTPTDTSNNGQRSKKQQNNDGQKLKRQQQNQDDGKSQKRRPLQDKEKAPPAEDYMSYARQKTAVQEQKQASAGKNGKRSLREQPQSSSFSYSSEEEQTENAHQAKTKSGKKRNRSSEIAADSTNTRPRESPSQHEIVTVDGIVDWDANDEASYVPKWQTNIQESDKPTKRSKETKSRAAAQYPATETFDSRQSGIDEDDVEEYSGDGFSSKFRNNHEPTKRGTQPKSQLAIVTKSSSKPKRGKQSSLLDAESTPRFKNPREHAPASAPSKESRTSISSSYATAYSIDSSRRNSTGTSGLVLSKVNAKPQNQKQYGKARNAKNPKNGNPIVPGATFSQNNTTAPKNRKKKGDNDDEWEWDGTTQKTSDRWSETPQPRRSARHKFKSPDVVDLLDSDGEMDHDESLPAASQGEDDIKAQSKVELDVPRIAVGKKLIQTDCHLVYHKQTYTLELFGKRDKRTRGKKAETEEKIAEIDFRDEALLQIKAFRCSDAGEEDAELDFSFLAFRVVPGDSNCLQKFSSAYKFQDTPDASCNSYVIVEFRSPEDYASLLQPLQDEVLPEEVQCKLEKPFSYLNGEEAREFATSLTKRSVRRAKKKVTDDFVGGRSEDDVLLVYPFAGDVAEIENAADDLKEAKGVNGMIESGIALPANEQLPQNGESDTDIVAASSSDEKGNVLVGGSSSDAAPKKSERRHFLTIQVRDFERLCPGEFLNDTLIDFWIQWITRNLDGYGPSVHCFSSHFFTTLLEDGFNAVQKWTANKDIDIFEKKFVFIPINETLHWSLCVVVNPGYVLHRGDDDPMACILFLDSLKAHKKSKVYKKIKEWLNGEWRRLKKGKEAKPFDDREGFPLLDPRIPYQDNSWDCGVFVCKYAYAVYSLVNREFCRSDRWFEKDLTQTCDEFKFDMSEIGRLRDEIRVLVQNLSKIYLPWKKEETRIAKEERKKARDQAAEKASTSSAAESKGDSEGQSTENEIGERAEASETLDNASSRNGESATQKSPEETVADCSAESNGAESDARSTSDPPEDTLRAETCEQPEEMTEASENGFGGGTTQEIDANVEAEASGVDQNSPVLLAVHNKNSPPSDDRKNGPEDLCTPAKASNELLYRDRTPRHLDDFATEV